jgi:hypothetical protein
MMDDHTVPKFQRDLQKSATNHAGLVVKSLLIPLEAIIGMPAL